LPCAARATSAGFSAPRFPGFTATTVCDSGIVTTRRQPVVTMRAMPQPARTFRWLAQVTPPSDGLPCPSSVGTAQGGPFLPAPRGLGARLRLSGEPRSPGSRVHLDGSSSYRKRHRRKCRVPRRQAAQQRHETGVVSRVPRGSRHAQACGTDRNTYQTGSTHQQQRETETNGKNECWRCQGGDGGGR
jgi:hypothetical protein